MKIVNSLKGGSVVSGAAETLSKFILGNKDIDASSKALIGLLGAVIWADGKVDVEEIDGFRELLPADISQKQADSFVEELKSRKDWGIKEGVEIIATLSDSEKRDIMSSLTRIALYNGKYNSPQKKVLEEVAEGISFPLGTLAVLEEEERLEYERRKRIMRSWTGIIVALIIVLIFVLTATFLKSVLFGFILAFVFLPLERFYERRLEKPGIILRTLGIFGKIFAPLKKFSEKISKRFVGEKKVRTPEQVKRKIIEGRVSKAVGATALTFVFIVLVFVVLASSLSAKYVAGLGGEIKSWADKQVQAEQKIVAAENAKEANDKQNTDIAKDTAKSGGQVESSKTPHTDEVLHKDESYLKSFIGNMIHKLESMRKDIEKWPLVQWCVEELSKLLKDKNNQKALISMIIKRTGGVFSFTAGFLSNFVGILFDALMTLFFFLLFLQKLALFTATSGDNSKNGGMSNYIVKSIFSSNWMPYTGEETRAQARKILNDIGIMLKTWIKGYLSIIVIESTVYITSFFLLGVPYALILGFLAGCTILLPYIGPFASASLTVLVCLAVGGSQTSILVILAVLLLYVLMNGILEQFFIYPALVGEALGLTNLETIIVVLLGGMFAGLSGMIFAVPAASIIKYIVPKIYSCWQPMPGKEAQAQ